MRILKAGKVVKELPFGASLCGTRGDAVVLDTFDLQEISRIQDHALDMILKDHILPRINDFTKSEFLTNTEPTISAQKLHALDAAYQEVELSRHLYDSCDVFEISERATNLGEAEGRLQDLRVELGLGVGDGNE